MDKYFEENFYLGETAFITMHELRRFCEATGIVEPKRRTKLVEYLVKNGGKRGMVRCKKIGDTASILGIGLRNTHFIDKRYIGQDTKMYTHEDNNNGK